MNYKRISIVLFTLSFIMILIGSTFAYWSWETTESKRTMVTFTVTDYLTCSADGGGDIVGTKIAPAPCTDPEYAIRRRIDAYTTSTEDRVINMDLWLEIDNISSGFLNSNNFKYALTTSAGSCYDGVINSGVFKTDISSNKVTLLNHEDEYIGTDAKTYWLWIWLDEEESDPSTMNQTFKAHLNGSCNDTGEIITKKYVNFGSNGQYFKATDYRDKITSISIVNEINVPSGATSWNLGVSPSNVSDVVGWLEDDGSGNDTYDLKIGTNGGRMYGKGSFSWSFSNLTNISSINFDGLNTSEVTNMVSMFDTTGVLATHFNLNLGSEFNTSNVTGMNGMFRHLAENSLNVSIDLGNYFDTSNVTAMIQMFLYACKNVTNFNINLGNHFNTSKVTNMYGMFSYTGQNATSFNLNLGNNFDTSNVTVMSSMFSYTGQNASMFSLNLGNRFNTSNVKYMSQMFSSIGQNDSNFTLNLGNHFNTSNVIEMLQMFSHVGQNVTNFSLNLGNHFNTSKVTNMYGMFSYTGQNASMFSLNLGNQFNTSNVTNMSRMFFYIGQNTSNFTLNLGNHFNTSNVIDMSYMFGEVGLNAINLTLNLGNQFNTSNVTNMSRMFQNLGANAVDFTLNLGNQFNTSKVIDMRSMFDRTGIKSQTNFTLDLSSGNFNNVTNNTSMFYDFPTSKATIYVKDAEAQQWIIAQNSGFNASNVLIKGNS